MTVKAMTCDLCDCGGRMVEIDGQEFFLSEEEWLDFVKSLD